MAAHSIEISDCNRDIAEVPVRICDTIQWQNTTNRRVNLVLPEPKILKPANAREEIAAGAYSEVYTVESGSGRRDYSFNCIGTSGAEPPLSPRTGTINVEG